MRRQLTTTATMAKPMPSQHLRHQDSNTPTETDETSGVSDGDGDAADASQSSLMAGWVFTSHETVGHDPRKRTFQRRFCRVHALACRFYKRKDDSTASTSHVIMHLRVVPERNQTLCFMDDDGHCVYLHPSTANTFTDWWRAFYTVLQRCPHAVSTSTSNRNSNSSSGTGSRSSQFMASSTGRPRVATLPTVTTQTTATVQRMRAHTAPPRWIGTGRGAPQRDPHTLVPAAPITTAAWVSVRSSWWRFAWRWRGPRHRFFLVLCGSTLSGFTLNQEGQRAAFTHTVTGIRYDPDVDPLAATVQLQGATHRDLHLSVAADRSHVLHDLMAHVAAAAAAAVAGGEVAVSPLVAESQLKTRPLGGLV